MNQWDGEGRLQDARCKECSHSQSSTSASFPRLRRRSAQGEKTKVAYLFTRKKSRQDIKVWGFCDEVKHADTQIPGVSHGHETLGSMWSSAASPQLKIALLGRASGDSHLETPTVASILFNEWRIHIPKETPLVVARNGVALISESKQQSSFKGGIPVWEYQGCTAHSVALCTPHHIRVGLFRVTNFLVSPFLLGQECTESAI